MAQQQYCSKCGRTMADTNFYTYKNGSKCELCKSCLTMHVNNFEPDTYMWLLEKFDVPYIEAEWNVLRDRAYQKDPYKMTGMSVFGKYLSKMKLKQWNKYGWADTEALQAKAEQNRRELGEPDEIQKQKIEEMKEAYKRGEISEAQYQTYAEIHAPEPKIDFSNPTEIRSSGVPNPYPANSDFEQVELVDVGADLTNEDKIYLAMKWGRLYHADEWVALEQLYTEFMNTFDIQGAARIDTLKMICKTSLKMNQAIDCGDVDTYQKLSRVYDAMMKSAKFTEAQNKDGKEDFVDSVGQLVAYCEKEGGQIPKFEIKVDHDVVDTIIRDLKDYNKSLIYEDKSLAQEIEQYLANKEAMEMMKRDREEARRRGLDQVEIEDKDFQDFRDAIHEDKKEDYQLENGEE
jgi:hypothetical protein